MLLWIEYSWYLAAAAAMGISLMRAGSVSNSESNTYPGVGLTTQALALSI